MNSSQIIKELKLNPKDILNIYLMGSRLWGTSRPNSDFDVIIVCQKYDGPMTLHTPQINATILDLNMFLDRVKNHEYLETVAIHSPSEFHLLEDMIVKLPKFKYDLFKKSIEYRIDRDLAHITKNDQKGKYDRANKTRYMCLNMLAIATEITKHHQSGTEINFKIASELKKNWTKFEFDTTFQRLRDQFYLVLTQPSTNDQ